MGLIQRLPQDVVNLMAAGEVLARPFNAIKELVENSLDAGSTEIMVNMQNCGLKLLQVTDNGKGIDREDFDLVCERFATSKLQKFEDLSHMKTYGFRGEALASLSHVSKVNIVSKKADSNCAYQANYLDGKMIGDSKPSAGKNGTCVTSTDLFYNLPQRRSKMATHNEESKMVYDTLMRFAIHRPDVTFALRQNQSNDFRTKGDGNLRDVISLLLGRDIADNLIPLKLHSSRLKFEFSGNMSMPVASATAKTSQNKKIRNNYFSVFINGRIVKCDILKHPIDDVLSNLSLTCQFCSVDLKIDETRIDVNVHPTKSSVLFLEKEEIVEEIKEYIEKLMHELLDIGGGKDKSMTTQSVGDSDNNVSLNYSQFQPVHPIKSIEAIRRSTASTSSSGINSKPKKSFQSSQNEKKRVDYMENRVDSKERRLDEFLVRCNNTQKSNRTMESTKEEDGKENDMVDDFSKVSMVSINNSQNDTIESTQHTKTHREFNLDSVKSLRSDICENTSLPLREMFKTFVFVGSVDTKRVLIQFGTSLYQLTLDSILREFFYQTAVFSFGNYGSFKMTPDPLKVVDLFDILADMIDKDSSGDFDRFKVFADPEKRKAAEEFFSEHADMLHDYFSLTFEWIGDDSDKSLVLTSIPSLVHYYVPQIEKLPIFLATLTLNFDYDNEKECFEGICRSIADFFVISEDYLDGDKLTSFSDMSWTTAVGEVLMPLVKRKFLPPEDFRNNKVIYQLADSHDLYKVFERCGT